MPTIIFKKLHLVSLACTLMRQKHYRTVIFKVRENYFSMFSDLL